MTPLRWDRIKQIVGDALDLQREARPAFIERACGEDADLRLNVDTLLRADQPGSPFLNLDREPERLGPWRVVREIGRGGMGTVYLAERDDGQFEQRAAIKVIKRGMDTDSVLRRFYAERRILARLQHPNITRLLEGGMFDNRPYFVMEYLEGEPLTAYCRRTNASPEQRIALFLTICDAVEYAHRNLILHRDLTTRHPENDDAQRFLAQSEKRLAYFYITRIRDFPKAGGHLAISLNIDRQRLARQPANVAVKLDLELDYAYLAGLFRREGDLPAALRYQQSATAARTEVLAADPRNFRVRDLSIADRARLGALFRDMKRPAEARAAFEQGFQLAHEGDPVAMSTPDAESAIADLRMESTAPPAPKGGMAQRTR